MTEPTYNPDPGPDYAVFRPATDLPHGFLPDSWNGLWVNITEVARRTPFDGPLGTAVAVPSGRFEVRDDGAVAEVYEFRP